MSDFKRRSRFLGVGATAASLMLFAGACGGEGGEVSTGPEEGDGGGKAISIGMIPWEEDITVTHLWKVVLEEKGYDVTIENLDVAPIFEGAANGDLDLFLDTWLPMTHAEYWDEYGDQIEDLGAWNENASLQITVPSYVDEVDSIADLKDNADLFDGEIIGIESGAGITKTTNESMIPDYGLEDDFELVESSTPAMLEALETAIKDEEPIAVTLWRPHPAYASLDLKDLEDPEGSMGEAESLHVMSREGFADDFPDVAKWMENFEVGDEQLADMEQVVLEEYEDEKEEGARVWLADNPDFLEGIMGEDAEGLDFSS